MFVVIVTKFFISVIKNKRISTFLFVKKITKIFSLLYLFHLIPDRMALEIDIMVLYWWDKTNFRLIENTLLFFDMKVVCDFRFYWKKNLSPIQFKSLRFIGEIYVYNPIFNWKLICFHRLRFDATLSKKNIFSFSSVWSYNFRPKICYQNGVSWSSLCNNLFYQRLFWLNPTANLSNKNTQWTTRVHVASSKP